MSAATKDTAVRAAVLAAAAAATLLGGPAWLRVALWALVALALGQRVARARRAGAPRGTLVERTVDPLLVAVGASLAVLVLLGYALEAVSVPLATTGWTVAVVAAGLATLAITRAHAAPRTTARVAAGPAPDAASGAVLAPAPGEARARRAPALVTAGWTAVALVLVGAAFTVAVTGARETGTPPLDLSLRDLQATSVQVVVASPGDVGPLEVRTDAGEASTLTYPPLTVVDGRSASTRVLLPPKGKVSISVYNAGQAEPLRTVIVDR